LLLQLVGNMQGLLLCLFLEGLPAGRPLYFLWKAAPPLRVLLHGVGTVCQSRKLSFRDKTGT
jgi:hypothetical protein